jgi:hypothetical protein
MSKWHKSACSFNEELVHWLPCSEGFDEFVLQFKHSLADVSRKSFDRIAQKMMLLAQGKKSSAGKNLIDIYGSGFYSEPNSNLRDTSSPFYTNTTLGFIIANHQQET